MNLHYETVSPLLVEYLQRIMSDPVFSNFVLVGGTCLSLQLGHRRSIDIDLFTDMDYGEMDTYSMKKFLYENFPYTERLNTFAIPALGYSLYIGESPIDKIKVDFFYTEKFIFPIQQIEDIRLADVKEIAAMKLGAICQDTPRMKDFWDIHELTNMYSISDMIKWGVKRNEWSVREEDIIRGFQRMDYVKESPEGIDCYRGKYWSLIKEDLQELINEYLQTKE